VRRSRSADRARLPALDRTMPGFVVLTRAEAHAPGSSRPLPSPVARTVLIRAMPRTRGVAGDDGPERVDCASSSAPGSSASRSAPPIGRRPGGREVLVLEARRRDRHRRLEPQQRGDPCRHLQSARQALKAPAVRRGGGGALYGLLRRPWGDATVVLGKLLVAIDERPGPGARAASPANAPRQTASRILMPINARRGAGRSSPRSSAPTAPLLAGPPASSTVTGSCEPSERDAEGSSRPVRRVPEPGVAGVHVRRRRASRSRPNAGGHHHAGFTRGALVKREPASGAQGRSPGAIAGVSDARTIPVPLLTPRAATSRSRGRNPLSPPSSTPCPDARGARRAT